nr:VWA domain-containing protein [Allocatelliglobosispora scoriae]
MAVILVAAGSFGAYQYLQTSSCSGEANLSVAAAPEIVPALRAAAARLAAQKADVDGACVAIEVKAADPADVASAVAARYGASLTGVGQPNGTMEIPDVWVPDSSTWLARISTASTTFAESKAAAQSASIARSPVVLAMPEPVAASLGWPTKKLTWPALLQSMTASTKLHVGIVDPSRDSAGLAGLLALGAAASTAPDAATASTAALRALAAGRSALRDDVLARFPRSTDAAAVASALGAAPLSEQSVITYNSAQPPVRLAAVYLEPAPLPLNYPFALLPGADVTQSAVANRLSGALLDPAFRDDLAVAGLRAADGTTGATFAAPKGAPSGDPATATSPAPTASTPAALATLDRALSTWAAVTLPARMLAVIDVSGSMLERVPTAGNATREQVTLEAARRGLGLFDEAWAVGLWIFSTELDGAKDHKQLVPIGPLATQRNELLSKLAAIQPKPQGDTGLYDTILAAYQAVQKDWDPGRVNSVVLLTDGDNDDDNGIEKDVLLSKLKETADPQKPIQVIIIGIGDVNPAPLEQITKQTGGGVFVTKDPAKIGDIFLKAIALRSTS